MSSPASVGEDFTLRGCMNNSCRLLSFCLMLLLTMAAVCIRMKINFVTDRSSRIAELEAQNMIQDKQIKELQKEVRLLKTDLDISKNGFRENKE